LETRTPERGRPIKLTWNQSRFELITSRFDPDYDYTAITLAGFRRDSTCFWTGLIEVARKFEKYADESAKAMFRAEDDEVASLVKQLALSASILIAIYEDPDVAYTSYTLVPRLWGSLLQEGSLGYEAAFAETLTATEEHVGHGCVRGVRLKQKSGNGIYLRDLQLTYKGEQAAIQERQNLRSHWEYRMLETPLFHLNETLHRLGTEGWEQVRTVSSNDVIRRILLKRRK
jgi:hypothetical protein